MYNILFYTAEKSEEQKYVQLFQNLHEIFLHLRFFHYQLGTKLKCIKEICKFNIRFTSYRQKRLTKIV